MSRKSKSGISSQLIGAPKAVYQALHGSDFPRFYGWALVICTLLASAVGSYLLQGEYREQVGYWQERLARAADANQQLLEHWVRDRNDDAKLLASFPDTQEAVREKGGGTRPPQVWQQRLHEEVVAVADTYSYAGAYILDRDGNVRAQSDHSPLPPCVAKGAIGISEQKILTIPASRTHPGYPQVAFFNPIRYLTARTKDQAAKVIGYVVLLTRPEAIGSLLLVDGATSASSETLLVAQSGNQTVFISPLRHRTRNGTVPSPPAYGPAYSCLARKKAIFGQYRDYRGVPVWAAGRFLPDLQWAMVTKVDRKEALSRFRVTLILGIGIALLLIVAVISMTAAWVRQHRIQRLQADLAQGKQTEAELRQSEERFGDALEHSPVTVFNQDRELRYTWVYNPQPPWSGFEYLGKTDQEVIGPEYGARLSALKSPVLETGIGVRKEWSFVYRGEKRYYDINIHPLWDSQGKVTGITCAGIDITDRKQVEERLKESERKYRRLFETTEAFVQTNMAGHFCEINPAFQAMLGYSAEELKQITYLQVTPEKWHAKEAEIVRDQVLRRGYSDTYEKEYRRKDGTIFPVELRAFLVRDERNQPVGMQAMVRDISERKQAEEKLREYEKVVEGLQDIITVVDKNYRYLMVNRAFLNYRGVTKEQILGRRVQEAINPGVFESYVKEKLDECLQGKVVTYELKYSYPNLGEKDLLLSYFPIEGDNGVDRVACVLRDITEPKRVEKALRDSEAHLRAFIEHAPYGILRYANNRFLSANPALVRILGYKDEAELLALNVAGDIFHDTAECRDLMALFKQPPNFGPLEVRWKQRGGKMILARLQGRIAKTGENGCEIIEAIVEDMTQQRALEQHLRQADRMEAVGRLASGVAHDFNNLLLGINLNLENAIGQIEPGNHLLRDELEQALNAARSAALVARQLLGFGRRRTMQPHPINLNEVVIQSQDMVSRLAGEQIHIHLRLDRKLLKVKADPVEVQQIILNLVVNARDAMPSGGQITIKTANIDLEKVPAHEQFAVKPAAGSYVVLEVSDTGSGIRKETLQHIFEPFFTTKEEGTGLGLSTCYGIVTKSGGYISVQTELGQGTTIKSYLPLAKERQMSVA